MGEGGTKDEKAGNRQEKRKQGVQSGVRDSEGRRERTKKRENKKGRVVKGKNQPTPTTERRLRPLFSACTTSKPNIERDRKKEKLKHYTRPTILHTQTSKVSHRTTERTKKKVSQLTCAVDDRDVIRCQLVFRLDPNQQGGATPRRNTLSREMFRLEHQRKGSFLGRGERGSRKGGEVRGRRPVMDRRIIVGYLIPSSYAGGREERSPHDMQKTSAGLGLNQCVVC